MRATTTIAARRAMQTVSRATIREVDDNHLMQEVKQADVHHGETPTDFERWQMVGITAVPLKQEQKKQAKATPNPDITQADWNHDQPRGQAAEAVMVYPGAVREHPIAIVDDRRVRPYGMKPGRGAAYAPDGSEQMVYFHQDGTFVVSLDGKSVEEPNGNRTRMVSLRHVTKDMQTHKIEEGQQQQEEYKHEGKTVNTEVRCTADKVEVIAGGVKAVYTKSTDTWVVTAGSHTKLTLTPSKIVGEFGDSKFAANATGAQIKKGSHHATVTAGAHLIDRAWTIGADPMSGV